MSSAMVGSADEPDQECVTRLPLHLLSFPVHSLVDHDDNSGCSTPPFQVSVSVPFKWEEEPGKPIPCTDLIHFTEPISLKLIPPPRMAWVDPKVTKTPSPTTVLDGSCLSSPERGKLGPMIMSNNREKMLKKKRLFGSWSWRSDKSKRSGKMGKREGLGGSFVYSSSSSAATSFDDGMDCCSEYGGESECVAGGDQVKMSKIKKSKSFLSLTQVNKILLHPPPLSILSSLLFRILVPDSGAGHAMEGEERSSFNLRNAQFGQCDLVALPAKV
ncbi:hypothetical protein QQ045_031526 [Rhodiola kirilowii]